jgi:hypothetical protein
MQMKSSLSNNILSLILLFGLYLGSTIELASAQDSPQTVYFAGLAFLGNADDAEENLPRASRFLTVERLEQLNRSLFERLTAVSRQDLRLTTNLGDSGSGDAIAMAIALDQELTTVEFGKTAYISKVRLWLQILTFDFTSKKLLSADPVRITVIQSSKERPSEEQVSAWLFDLYDQNSEFGIVNQVVKKFPHVKFHKGWQAYIQVRNVEITSSTTEKLSRQGISENSFKIWLAGTFSSALSENQKIPVLPYARGQAVGGAMAARFANSDTFNFTLPKADYVIDLKLRGFVKKMLDETPETVGVAYGVGARVEFTNPSFQKTYFAENIQLGVPEKMPRGQFESAQDWNYFVDATAILFDQFSQQISEPQKTWIETHVDSKNRIKEISRQLKSVDEKMLRKVRGEAG